ncbi:hypothetical protein [Gimesia aquarii]|uniref:Bacterial EndoU nuclease domain-containing protein n=1 Tax=Gimesia aquarii TaxID=2527964 RepID=A0A517WND9_9PLAN|nr:hypothetical protein [Gimesia aquarii]QDU06779.1 hypothetical protein V202x_01220 [Gimesia aquarii]
MNQPNKRTRTKVSSLGWTVTVVLFLIIYLVIQGERNHTNDQSVLNSEESRAQNVLDPFKEASRQSNLEKELEAQQSDLVQQNETDISKSKNYPVTSSQVSKKQTPANSNRPPPLNSSKQSKTAKPSLELGQLRDLGSKVWESAAGLKYGPGSREKHRLLHVMRHAEDQPNRPGKHGVFAGEGNRKKVLALIDEAYLQANKGRKSVEKKKERNRIVYTVDMGRRIGFVGGQVGNKQGKPPAFKIRLILEGTNVITAFPL